MLNGVEDDINQMDSIVRKNSCEGRALIIFDEDQKSDKQFSRVSLISFEENSEEPKEEEDTKLVMKAEIFDLDSLYKASKEATSPRSNEIYDIKISPTNPFANSI